MAPVAIQPVMIFIDGGYLRKVFSDTIKTDKVNFDELKKFSLELVNSFSEPPIYVKPKQKIPIPSPEPLIYNALIRAFYYDAIIEKDDDPKKYAEQEEYLRHIRSLNFYEVKLGRLIKSGKGEPKQEGVDVLLAIDMITRAYENQYDIAVLVAGDDDFVDVVKAVKNTGKRVYGIYSEKCASSRLIDSFDVRHPLTRQDIDQLCIMG